MKKLAWHSHCFLTVFVTGAVFSVTLLALQPPNWKLLATAILATTLATAFLFGRTRKSIKTAQLIIENQILHIQPAVFQNQIREKKAILPSNEAIEVFVSCFGILLDYKIIKFNQDGIQLKAVELGRDFISFTYGTEKKAQSTKLLHVAINEDVLAEIVQRFRYETGIIPTLIH